MSKPNGPTWEQIRQDFQSAEHAVEARSWEELSTDYARNGHSTVLFRCPFCFRLIRARTWSMAGGGKRCECGALAGSNTHRDPQAYHWADITRRPKERS